MIGRRCFFLFLALVIVSGDGGAKKDNALETQQQLSEIEYSSRDGRFIWPFFQFIVVNEECTTTDTQTPTGTCVTSKECGTLGGTASGTCASGFAVCCISKVNCTGSTSQNNTYFVSPSYSTADTDTGACTFQLDYPSDVCQVRLDFIDFSLAQPDTDGQCVTDYLSVTGGTSTVPRICGENTGQHMYVDVSSTTSPLRLMVMRSSGSTGLETIWNIQVTQIPCGATYAAPSNCLQYFTTDTGTVSSFNYQGEEGQTPDGTNVEQLADQAYTICIRPPEEFCEIEWTRNSDNGNYGFSMTAAADSISPDVAGSIDAAEFECTTDYVIIAGGSYSDSSGDTVSGDRFCGQGFPDAVSSTIKPFNMYVITNEIEEDDGDTGNQGFQLDWTSKPCS